MKCYQSLIILSLSSLSLLSGCQTTQTKVGKQATEVESLASKESNFDAEAFFTVVIPTSSSTSIVNHKNKKNYKRDVAQVPIIAEKALIAFADAVTSTEMIGAAKNLLINAGFKNEVVSKMTSTEVSAAVREKFANKTSLELKTAILNLNQKDGVEKMLLLREYNEKIVRDATAKKATALNTKSAGVNASETPTISGKAIKSQDVNSYLKEVEGGEKLFKELQDLFAESAEAKAAESTRNSLSNADVKKKKVRSNIEIARDIAEKRREIAKAIKKSKVYKEGKNNDAVGFVNAVEISFKDLEGSLKFLQRAKDEIKKNTQYASSEIDLGLKLIDNLEITVSSVYHSSIEKIILFPNEACISVVGEKETWEGFDELRKRVDEAVKTRISRGCGINKNSLLYVYVHSLQEKFLNRDFTGAILAVEGSGECGTAPKVVAEEARKIASQFGSTDPVRLQDDFKKYDPATESCQPQ